MIRKGRLYKYRNLSSAFGIVLSITIGLATMWTVTHFIHQNRIKHLKATAEENADSIVSFMLEGRIAGATSQFGFLIPEIKLAAVGRISNQLTALDSIMEAFRSNNEAEKACILNQEGHIVLCKGGQNITGQDLSFRPYFKEAIKGKNSVYIAESSDADSGRAIFFSAPIYSGDTPSSSILGVIVLKFSIDQIDKKLSRISYPVLFLAPQGVVMSTNRSEWLYHVTGTEAVTEERVKSLANDTQFSDHFKKNRPISLPFDSSADYVMIKNQEYGVVTVPVDLHDPSGPWSLTLLDSSQAWFPLWIRLIIFSTSAAAVALFLLWIRGIAIHSLEREESLIQLKVANDEAQSANQAKSAFLAMMSHEIRTPMNGILSMAEMLESTELTEDQHEMSSVIYSSTTALLTIINDILDFSKIEAGKVEIENIPFSLIQTAEAVSELVIRKAEEKHLSLVLDIDPHLPDQLTGDPIRVRQILINLLGNAIKFTEWGEVSLRVLNVSGENLNQNQRRIRFEVTDTGIGLNDEQIAKLFQPFQQADSTTSRKFGGTGLGLTISRQLCELMGGEIGVDSAAGIGSTFWFELQFDVDPTTVDKPPIDISDASIVVVSMEGRARTALTGQLTAAKINDVYWTDISQVFNYCKNLSTDKTPLVLINVLNENPETIELGHTLAKSFQNRIKVVLLISLKMASSIDMESKADFFATLSFPIRSHRLWRVIAASLGRAELNVRADERVHEESWTPPELETAYKANAAILVAEDNLTNQKVIKRLLTKLGYAHKMVNNGQEALEEFKKRKYGLILTDFHMPIMDGFELATAVRKIESKKDKDQRVPIIVLSADVLPRNELDASSPIDSYLHKPIDFQNLINSLEKFIPQAKALRSPVNHTSNISNKDSSFDSDVFDLELFKKSFGDLDSETIEFLSGFLSESPQMLEQLNVALKEGNVLEAREEAHALKGAALSVSAIQLGKLAGVVQDCLDKGDIVTARVKAEALPKKLAEFKNVVTPYLK